MGNSKVAVARLAERSKEATARASESASGNLHELHTTERRRSVFRRHTDIKPLDIALFDDRPLRRDSLLQLMETRMVGLSISCFSTVPSITDDVRLDCRFQLLVLSIGAASLTGNSAKSLLNELRDKLPDVPLVIFCDPVTSPPANEELCQLIKLLREGVRGYIPTTLSSSVMGAALRLVAAGGVFLPPELYLGVFNNFPAYAPPTLHTRQVQRSPELEATLTPRELEVLHQLRQGESNKVIAYALNMQECTVKVHIRRIMKKLNASNRTHAAMLANQLFLDQNGGTGDLG